MTATLSPEELAERLEVLAYEVRVANAGFDDAASDLRAAAALIRELVGREKAANEVVRFVTRYVWSKPDLSDVEIVEVLRFYPAFRSMKDQWGRIAEDMDDQHTLSKIAAVEAARAAKALEAK